MNRRIILKHGTEMRDCVLRLYQGYPQDDAAQVTRRMVYEIGKVFGDLHGHDAAAAMMYSAADALVAKTPVEDFRLMLSTGAGAAAPAPPTEALLTTPTTSARAARIGAIIGGWFGDLFKAATDRFFIGFVLGLIAGRP